MDDRCGSDWTQTSGSGTPRPAIYASWGPVSMGEPEFPALYRRSPLDRAASTTQKTPTLLLGSCIRAAGRFDIRFGCEEPPSCLLRVRTFCPATNCWKLSLGRLGIHV